MGGGVRMLYEVWKVRPCVCEAEQGRGSHKLHLCRADMKNHHMTKKEPRPSLPSTMSFYPNNLLLINWLVSLSLNTHWRPTTGQCLGWIEMTPKSQPLSSASSFSVGRWIHYASFCLLSWPSPHWVGRMAEDPTLLINSAGHLVCTRQPEDECAWCLLQTAIYSLTEGDHEPPGSYKHLTLPTTSRV